MPGERIREERGWQQNGSGMLPAQPAVDFLGCSFPPQPPLSSPSPDIPCFSPGSSFLRGAHHHLTHSVLYFFIFFLVRLSHYNVSPVNWGFLSVSFTSVFPAPRALPGAPLVLSKISKQLSEL